MYVSDRSESSTPTQCLLGYISNGVCLVMLLTPGVCTEERFSYVTSFMPGLRLVPPEPDCRKDEPYVRPGSTSVECMVSGLRRCMLSNKPVTRLKVASSSLICLICASGNAVPFVFGRL